MRLKLKLASANSRTISLPIHYNSAVQGFIYSNLDEAVAHRFHNGGLSLGKRSFHLFTFSRLMGQYRISSGRILFTEPVELYVGSVCEELLHSLAMHLLTKESVRIGTEFCRLLALEVEETPPYARPVLVRALSPITVYSTLVAGDGRKKTYYYDPMEKEWEDRVLASLFRKAKALGWEEERLKMLEDARIQPKKVGKKDLCIVKYRSTVIKGWTGLYELDLPEPFFFLAYDSGLGSKNPQGFGMVQVVNE